jgi:hypothetical protein
MSNNKPAVVLCFLIAGFCAINVHAANLVVNGGFETGDSSGWTGSGVDVCSVAGGTPYGVPCLVHSGTYAANWAEDMSQVLSTVPGTSYNLSFYLADEIDGVGGGSPADEDNSLSVSFDGAVVYGPFTDIYQPSYELISIDGLQATSTTTTLLFSMSNDPGGFWLDDISVTPSSAPEPRSLGMAVLGMISVLALLVHNVRKLKSE